jgi:membrane protease YdiL (CAAX protease family)
MGERYRVFSILVIDWLPNKEVGVMQADLQFSSPPARPPDLPWGGKELIKAGILIVLGSLALMALAVFLLFASGMARKPQLGLGSPLLFGLGVGIYLLVIIAVYWFAVRRPGSSWQQVGLRPFASGWLPFLPILVVVQLLGMALINTQLVALFTGGKFENPQVEAVTGGMHLSRQDLFFLLLLIAIIAPIAEELFFRGMLYPVLRRRWSVRWAIGINALLFALVHFIPLLLPALFFIGLIFAWVRERTQSIIPSILLHAMQNGLVIVAIYASSVGGG